MKFSPIIATSITIHVPFHFLELFYPVYYSVLFCRYELICSIIELISIHYSFILTFLHFRAGLLGVIITQLPPIR
jgi:hypothetical protein